MINTASTDFNHVLGLGQKVVNEVNKLYRAVELEIDGVFKSMLLLKKKKYAAMTISRKDDGTIVEKAELKGLDLVRRDWCQLSKKSGEFVVGKILSGNACDDVVVAIHDRMETLAATVRADSVRVLAKEELRAKYVITKGLNKSPNDYPDVKSQPHLQVALRMLKVRSPWLPPSSPVRRSTAPRPEHRTAPPRPVPSCPA